MTILPRGQRRPIAEKSWNFAHRREVSRTGKAHPAIGASYSGVVMFRLRVVLATTPDG